MQHNDSEAEHNALTQSVLAGRLEAAELRDGLRCSRDEFAACQRTKGSGAQVSSIDNSVDLSIGPMYHS